TAPRHRLLGLYHQEGVGQAVRKTGRDLLRLIGLEGSASTNEDAIACVRVRYVRACRVHLGTEGEQFRAGPELRPALSACLQILHDFPVKRLGLQVGQQGNAPGKAPRVGPSARRGQGAWNSEGKVVAFAAVQLKGGADLSQVEGHR